MCNAHLSSLGAHFPGTAQDLVRSGARSNAPTTTSEQGSEAVINAENRRRNHALTRICRGIEFTCGEGNVNAPASLNLGRALLPALLACTALLYLLIVRPVRSCSLFKALVK